MITEQTKITTDFKTLGLTIFAVAISVWAYFGIVERLNRLETNTLFHYLFFNLLVKTETLLVLLATNKFLTSILYIAISKYTVFLNN